MISIPCAKSYCAEDISLIENYEEAVNSPDKWVCHHRKETDEGYSRKELIEKGLYYDRPANELILLTKTEHTIIHRPGKHNKGRKLPERTEEHKRKLSEALKGKKHTEERRKNISIAAKNRPPISEETRKKMSEAHKGKKHKIK